MSANDLTRRARDWATGPIAARSSESTSALVSELADEVDRLRAENEPAACEMTRTPPFDFAQCETHDTTFPLGAVCKFHERDPFDVLYEEVDEQRTRAVRAEMERDAARAALERVQAATQEAHLWYSEEGRELIAVRDVLNALEGES